jgi:hypothetical protein
MDEQIQKCLLGILQRGITEARSCALVGENKTAADLLDALDNIPRHLANWTPDSEIEIAMQLDTFRKQHPDHATDFAAILRQRRQVLY